MKKLIVIAMLVAMSVMYAADNKVIVFGAQNSVGGEYDATTILDVTYKAWLETGTGAAVDSTGDVTRSTDGLPGCVTEHYFGVRGASKVDLQFFNAWGMGNELHVIMKDEAGGVKVYYENSAPMVWVVDDLGGTVVENGFLDFAVGTTMPWSLSAASSIEGNMPLETSLEQNYPNPFNPTTTINFSIAQAGNVKLNVYNFAGQLVSSMVNGTMSAGFHTVNFDASNLSAGVYYYTLEANNMTMTNKMILVK